MKKQLNLKKVNKKIICIFLGFFCAINFLKAQNNLDQNNFPPPKKPLTVYATKLKNNIKLDGKLSEADWKLAKPITNFVQVEPYQGEPSNFNTVVKILFDKKNLYIGAFCKDTAGKKGIRVQDFRRDFSYFKNDLFGVAIDPFNGKRNALGFQTNPYGALRDLQVFDDIIFDREWDALWNARSFITSDGWSCEIAIPWKTLRYPKANKDSVIWGINFNRIARKENENSTFSPYPRSFDGYRMTYAAELKGLEPPKPGINIQVNPFWVNEYNGKNYNTKVGGEVKLSPTVHSTLDLTFNTDFAQADVDRQVNNLTRFSVFFPERRQFFLENAGLFDAGDEFTFKPFFSRTIGLDNDGNPLPIDAGIRFTDKNNNYSLGGLYVHQRETTNTAAANIGVLRYLKNYGKQNNIGVIFTNKTNQANNNFKNSNNTAATITGFNRFSDKLSFNYTLSGTNTTGNLKDNGTASYTSLNYQTNNFVVLYNTSFVSKNFNPQLGFVARTNFVKNYFDAYFIKRKQKWFPNFIRSWEPGVSADIYQNTNNLGLQEAFVSVYPVFLVFNNGGKFVLSAHLNWQNLTANFNPVGIEITKGNYQYNQINIEYESDPSSKFSYETSIQSGNYYNGNITAVNGSVRYAPSPHLAFNIDYEANFLRNIGLAKENLNTQLVTPNIRMALNPRLQINVFYQYNTATERSRWNTRFSWEYKPLSYIYLVWNENKINNLTENQTIAKISFLKQF